MRISSLFASLLANALLALVLLCCAGTIAPPALAGAFNPQDFTAITSDMLHNIAAFVGLGADIHPYEAAKPFSSMKGVDFGASVTGIQIPGSTTEALSTLGITGIPHYFPLPKVNIQKGLFNKFIVGTEFLPTVKIQGNKFGVFGADAQWTMIDRPRLPPVALRAQYNYTDLAFLNAATYGGDVLTSYNVLFVHFYGGAGYRYVHANIANPTSSLPVHLNVNFTPNVSAGHFFAGSSVTAGFTRITVEADLTNLGVNTYGTKLSFFF